MNSIRSRLDEEWSDGCRTLSPFQLAPVPAGLEQMHVVAVLLLRLLTQKLHLVVDGLQWLLLRNRGPAGSPPPAIAGLVGRPREGGKAPSGGELLKVIVAAATIAL